MTAARAIVVLVLVGACAQCAPSSAVQTAGAESYVVSARAPSGHAGVLIAQNAALGNARAYCASQGRRFVALNDQVGEETFSTGVTYTVQFRCPMPGSPELPRPRVDQAPDDIL